MNDPSLNTPVATIEWCDTTKGPAWELRTGSHARAFPSCLAAMEAITAEMKGQCKIVPHHHGLAPGYFEDRGHHADRYWVWRTKGVWS